jgi:hypothetical protein
MLPLGNLSQPLNPRPIRLLAFYSSPVAIGFSGYEIQSLQLLIPPRTLREQEARGRRGRLKQ